MKRKSAWLAVGVLATAAIVWFATIRTETASAEYRFVEVTRADLESSVTATGTLQATETVEVGTQVSGQLAEIYVDFNDAVEPGQLLARIDPVILEQEVRSAEVNLARNEAELSQNTRELDRTRELHETQVVTDSELDLAEYRFALADAAFRSAEISLERARRNLQYTEIRAPINGVVVSRDVEVGQTVAASLSAPILFVLAQDLAEMEILASVDESDIGQIQDSQPVHFTVQAFPDREFEGVVEQVRLQSATQENVVTYSVVVRVENRDGALLPGMTATLDIVIEREEDVLIVPNTALRFRPTEEMLEAVALAQDGALGDGGDAGEGAPMRRNRPLGDGSVRERGFPPGDRAEAGGAGRGLGGGTLPTGERPGMRGGGRPGSGFASLWFLGDAGELRFTPVRTGLTDGLQTVILRAPDDVGEGLQVIAAVTTGTPAASVQNPFQNQQRGGFRRPGGF